MSNDEARMTFTEHLAELRTRIIRSGLAIVIGFVLCYIFSNQIFAVVKRPLMPLKTAGILVEDPKPGEEATAKEGAETPEKSSAEEAEEPKGAQWVALNPLEPFLVKLKLSAYAGLLLTLPFLIYQVCGFIFPGLTPRERRAAHILLSGSTVLVILGVSVAYFFTFPLALPYIMQFAPEGVDIQLRMSETISLILKGLMGFAIAFQFPMVVLILVYLELLTPAGLRQYRKFAIIASAFIGALFTPPDPLSMGIMMIPLVLLYEISIWVSYLVVWHKRNRKSEAV